jgi:hypothetical protein
MNKSDFQAPVNQLPALPVEQRETVRNHLANKDRLASIVRIPAYRTRSIPAADRSIGPALGK